MRFDDPGENIKTDMNVQEPGHLATTKIEHEDSLEAISRSVRFSGAYILNLLMAMFGTATLQTFISALLHPRSVQSALWRACGLSLVLALLVGAVMYKIFRTTTAKWVWVLSTLWLGGRVLLFLGAGSGLSYVWLQMSGMQCFASARITSCGTNFFIFTVPFLRGLAYSAGAQGAAVFLRTRFDTIPPRTLRS